MDRDLLAHDGAHQPAKTRGHLPQLGMSHFLQDTREVGIDFREVPHCLLEVGGIENHLSHPSRIARRAVGL
jgi:hypothetical protein